MIVRLALAGAHPSEHCRIDTGKLIERTLIETVAMSNGLGHGIATSSFNRHDKPALDKSTTMFQLEKSTLPCMKLKRKKY